MDSVITATDTPGQASFTPPMPPLAPDRVGALGVLAGLRRNAYSAFPPRCREQAVLVLPMLGRDVVVAAGPQAMRDVLATRPDLYRRIAAGDRIFGALIGRGVAASEGEAWRRQRRILAPAFTPRTVTLLAPHMAACAEAALGRLEASRGEPVNLLAVMQDLSLAIACTSMFSLEVDAFGPQLRALLLSYADGVGRPRASDFILPPRVPTLTTVRRARFRRRWRALIRAIIARRRAAHSPEAPRDLFDLLSEAYGDREEDLLADEVSTMIFAGHETTGLTLFWACYLLANTPDWRRAVRREARQVDLSPGGAGSAVGALPQTRAVVDEALRLYPPAYMTARQAVANHALCGVPVRRGAIVLMPFTLLHTDPRLWASPERFDPGRFLRPEKPDRYSFLPFGAGPRVCIGAQLATSEAVLVLARLLRDNDLVLDDDGPVLPVGSFATRPNRSPTFRLLPAA
ncbi:cytochrome P450 [Methylobacterium sp. PvR107]|uniref:cytochrome P450 n=1 Tax=Methylobacterium sp. PvR107 TaxID=2806597 RepID=UPI001AE69CC4|nr:cytochrome P450 [Methylobacterium sp. PvR107]MBP1181539.1 cytochrome P450 [Methylobacterium sp. PvR107]